MGILFFNYNSFYFYFCFIIYQLLLPCMFAGDVVQFDLMGESLLLLTDTINNN